jgi:hypothetical protein
MPPPMPAFTASIVGWLLRCFLPSAFVIARRHTTVNTLVAGHFCRQSSSTTTTTAATAAATPVVELTVLHCQRKRQQQHHHQRTNGSTNVKMFTSPVDLDLFNLSTVFEVCDVGRGNLVISKLLALKKLDHFCNLHTTG